MFTMSKFLPLVTQLGNYLKLGIDHYAALKSAGKETSVVILTAYLDSQMAPWKPKLGDKNLLDDETRAAAARFLAGVVVNLGG